MIRLVTAQCVGKNEEKLFTAWRILKYALRTGCVFEKGKKQDGQR